MRDVISTVQLFFNKKSLAAVDESTANFKRGHGVHGRGMGVHGRGMGVHAHGSVTPPMWTLCRRFIDVTPMESSKVAYYTPVPHLPFLTG